MEKQANSSHRECLLVFKKTPNKQKTPNLPSYFCTLVAGLIVDGSRNKPTTTENESAVILQKSTTFPWLPYWAFTSLSVIFAVFLQQRKQVNS